VCVCRRCQWRRRRPVTSTPVHPRDDDHTPVHPTDDDQHTCPPHSECVESSDGHVTCKCPTCFDEPYHPVCLAADLIWGRGFVRVSEDRSPQWDRRAKPWYGRSGEAGDLMRIILRVNVTSIVRFLLFICI